MRRIPVAIVAGVLFLAVSASAADSSSPALMTRPAGADAVSRATATLTVPADSEAAVTLLSGIHTRVSHVDDPIEAELLKPVYVEGQLALPAGSLLDGHITRVEPSGRFHHRARLAFQFDQIRLPDGQQAPVVGLVSGIDNKLPEKAALDAEGHFNGARGFSWKRLACGMGVAGAIVPFKIAMAGAASLKYFLPASGAALVGYELIFPHGGEVHLPPDTHLRVRFNTPVTVHARG